MVCVNYIQHFVGEYLDTRLLLYLFQNINTTMKLSIPSKYLEAIKITLRWFHLISPFQ